MSRQQLIECYKTVLRDFSAINPPGSGEKVYSLFYTQKLPTLNSSLGELHGS